MSNQDTPVSVVEELDPDVEPRATSIFRRELPLGLALLVAVLGWALWQGWHQQSQENGYRAAQKASAAKDWDKALELYTAADGYKDAPARAADANRLITRRDEQYGLLQAANSRGDWLVSLRQASMVSEIEPNYRDVDSLEASARGHLYTEALAGSVALRLDAQPQGLYYRTPAAWVYLVGSDRASRVLGISPDRVVYDAPGAGNGSSSPPPTVDAPFYFLPAPGSPELAGRRLMAMLATGGQPSFGALDLDPALYNRYTIGEFGVWAMRYASTGAASSDWRVQSWLTRQGASPKYEVAYQAFSAPLTSTITLDGIGWSVHDYSPDGAHLLLSQLIGTPEGRAISRLYLTDSAGKNFELIFSASGSIESATFGPDERHALVTVRSVYPHDPQERSVVLLDLPDTQGAAHGHTLVSGVPITGQVAARQSLEARFIKEGVLSGKVLVLNTLGSNTYVTLYDPVAPDRPLLEATLPLTGAPAVLVGSGSDSESGSLILGWRHGSGGVWPDADMISIAVLSPGKAPTLGSLPLKLGEDLTDVQLRAGYIVYATESLKISIDARPAATLRSFPAADLGKAQIKPAVICTKDTTGPDRQTPWSLGTGLLACSSSNGLQVKSYSGAAVATLERNTALLSSAK
jgi:hypothetical protein